MDLAGIEYDKNMYDGRSWIDGLLKSNENESNEWRQVYLSQYQSINTYTFSLCETWYPSSNGSVVPGDVLHPPGKNENGQVWYIDNTETNNWRALRIMNESVNWMYAEFVNASWNDSTFENPFIIEFYDIKQDPYQLNNTYDSLSSAKQQQLHYMLMNYGNCTGIDCW